MGDDKMQGGRVGPGQGAVCRAAISMQLEQPAEPSVGSAPHAVSPDAPWRWPPCHLFAFTLAALGLLSSLWTPEVRGPQSSPAEPPSQAQGPAQAAVDGFKLRL